MILRYYTNVFGTPSYCLKIKGFRESRAIDDCCTWLFVEACPNEIRRMLATYQFDIIIEKKSTLQIKYGNQDYDESLISSHPPKWWQPLNLGDSCLYIQYKFPDRDHIYNGYISLDSSRFYFQDIQY